MLSRAMSLDGVLILRPFIRAKVYCHLSEDLQTEIDKRLPTLACHTVIAHEVGESVQHAECELQQLERKLAAYRNSLPVPHRTLAPKCSAPQETYRRRDCKRTKVN